MSQMTTDMFRLLESQFRHLFIRELSPGF
jgi:hypothetical protein